MKKFITSIILFIPVCFTLYLVFVCVWGTYMPTFLKPNVFSIENNNTSVRLQEVVDYQNIDILFLGSSRAYTTFDVRLYQKSGYKVFNLGTSSQSPLQTKVLLERYLKSLKPKLVVFEVSTLLFASDGVESAADIISNGKLDYLSFLMALKLNNLKIYNSLIFKTYTEIFNKKIQMFKQINETGRTYIKGGYVEAKEMDYIPSKRANDLYSRQMNSDQIVAFEDIVELLKRNNINLVLVQVPFVKKVYERYDNDFFNSFISKYGTYYDFNKIEELSDIKYFRDDIHLNKEGVKKFNSYLFETLELNNN